MPRWKPKTPYEKFQAELKKIDARILAKQAELVELESARKQLKMVVTALAGVAHDGAEGRDE